MDLQARECVEIISPASERIWHSSRRIVPRIGPCITRAGLVGFGFGPDATRYALRIRLRSVAQRPRGLGASHRGASQGQAERIRV
jgi:hypothetical protein